MNLKPVKDTLIIAALKSIPDLKRNPLMLIVIGLISAIPLFFLLIFGGQISYGLVGALVSTVSFIGIAAAIQDITYDRYVKIREMIIAMPVHPVSYAVGVALAPLILSIPSLAFFMIIAIWIGALPLSSVGWLFASLILCWAALSGIGFIVSTYLRKASVYTLNNISNILGLGLIFMPPVYYPEEFLGELSWIAMIFPTSNAAGLIRAYSGLLELPPEIIMLRWALLFATTAISIIVVSLKSRWREA
ncbi:MAG: ABC transporter permease [Candidatus Bathyarchaeales archaeon]